MNDVKQYNKSGIIVENLNILALIWTSKYQLRLHHQDIPLFQSKMKNVKIFVMPSESK